MHMPARLRVLLVGFIVVLALAAVPFSADASHSWGNYHWARTSNPFTIKVIDSMTTNWDDNLAVANGDWDKSSVLNIVNEQGSTSTRDRKRCSAVSGKARACNAEYGYNGWLGLAQIWTSGSHIVQATAKMNDTYFNTSTYNDPTKKRHVVCQEIGHDWGLGHQDESGADLNTCMDYSSKLDNPEPDAHDYRQLETIYSHTDSTTTVASLPANVANAELNTPAEWGRLVHASERAAIYERDFGNGFKVVTHVTWAPDAPEGRQHAGEH